MIKMYLAEVLGKLPVAQHFLFGSLLPCPSEIPASSDSGGDDAHRGHAHNHPERGGASQTGWGDCCGIPVPSAFGAAAAERKDVGKGLQGPAIRPVPFD